MLDSKSKAVVICFFRFIFLFGPPYCLQMQIILVKLVISASAYVADQACNSCCFSFLFHTSYNFNYCQLRTISILQCNLDIRNPGYKEQLGYKELFSEFFFYVMGFLAIRNKFGIFLKLKNLDIRNDFQGKCNHFDQNFTETPLRVLFVMICNSCVCCFW